MKKPPKKLSELLWLALDDLEKVEKNEDYFVDMEVWHRGRIHADDEKCRVCLAGAVMANTLEVSPSANAFSDTFGDYWNAAFNALNYLRVGQVLKALYEFGVVLPTRDEWKVYNTDVCHYAVDKSKWREKMKVIGNMLEEAGL